MANASPLSHVEINVSDYEKSIQFYDLILTALGWKKFVSDQSHTTFSEGTMKIVICPTDEKYLVEGFHRKRIGLNHLAFNAQSKEKVDSIYQNILVKNNIPCLYDKKPNGDNSYYAVYFEDPDRMKIEIVYTEGYCSPNHWTNSL